MHPVLFNFGSWTIRSYDVVLCLATITGFFMVLYEARREGYPGLNLAVGLAGTVIFALIGARINGWLFWYDGKISMLGMGKTMAGNGMTAFGGYAGALGFMALYSHWRHWNILILLDILAPVLVLSEGIQRIGCFLNGCCHGRTTSSFFGVYLPDTLGNWTYRYPTQIITGIFCFLLFVWLWRYRKHKPFNGSILLYTLVLYHLGRVLIDFMRGDEPIVLGLLSAHQLTSAIITILAAPVLYILLEKRAREGLSGNKT